MKNENGLACLISGTIRYEKRSRYLDRALQEQGYRTLYITSNFDHIAKERFVCPVPGCRQIPVLPYYKNLSVRRVLSHWQFALRTVRLLETLPEEPKLIALIVPPNFGPKYMASYRRRHPSVKIVFDIFDLWPETFPSAHGKKLLSLPFAVWAGLRDKHLNAADFILTECDLYQEKLHLSPQNTETVYLSAEPLPAFSGTPVFHQDTVELCYLGSINNIVDTELICALIAELRAYKPVLLHLIGDGERRAELAQRARDAGAEVTEYGALYDEAKKHEIMNRCRFGLNIMKSSVCVGLTMKCIDYFHHGLPILNTIPADTERLLSARGMGIQLQRETLAAAAKQIALLTEEEEKRMRAQALRMFSELLDEKVICGQLRQIVRRILPEEGRTKEHD